MGPIGKPPCFKFVISQFSIIIAHIIHYIYIHYIIYACASYTEWLVSGEYRAVVGGRRRRRQSMYRKIATDEKNGRRLFLHNICII